MVLNLIEPEEIHAEELTEIRKLIECKPKETEKWLKILGRIGIFETFHRPLGPTILQLSLSKGIETAIPLEVSLRRNHFYPCLTIAMLQFVSFQYFLRPRSVSGRYVASRLTF